MEKNAKKIKVMFVLPNFDTGGSEKLVVDLAKHLDSARFSTVVTSFFGGVYRSEMEKGRIPYYAIHENGTIKGKLSIFRDLNRIVKEHGIDIVNTHHTSALLQGLP